MLKMLSFFWEIEKYLYEKNIQSKDIFYQTYNPQKGVFSLQNL